MLEHDRANLASALNDLAPKGKTPASARVLNAWIAQAQDRLGSAGPRLGWLVAATVVSAALQRAVDESGVPLFLLKGGTMLQYRLPGMSRTTQDIDGLVRGDIDRFLTELDKALAEVYHQGFVVSGRVPVGWAPARERNVSPWCLNQHSLGSPAVSCQDAPRTERAAQSARKRAA